MGIGSDFLREQLVFALDIVRKRWLLLCIPIVLASVLAYAAVHLAPTKYTASSVILLQGANRNVGGFSGAQHANTVEQVQAIEAWLKSDQIIAELLPQMTGYKAPESPIERLVQMRVFAASLSLEVVGNSVLQIKLTGDRPDGLGRNLESVLSRLMGGLTGPEQNIFSAQQFLNMHRSEEAIATERELVRAIEVSGLQQSPPQVRAVLHQLWMLKRQGQPADAAAADRLRRSISENAKLVGQLAQLYSAYRNAADRQAALGQAGPARSTYVGIFSSPENLLIVGRPKDPLVGESAARKLAIAGVLLGVVAGFGLVVVAELLGGVLRTRRDHEAASGLPIMARLSKMPQ